MTGERAWFGAAAFAAVILVAAVLAIAGVFSGDGEGGGDAADDDFGLTVRTEQQAAPPGRPSVKRIRVGGRPDAIAAGAGYVWITDSFAGTLRRIRPGSERPVDVEASGFPTDVSADADAAWLALPDRGAVQRVTVTGPEEPVRAMGFPFQIAAGEEAVWAMAQRAVSRVDPGGGPVAAPIPLGGNGAAIAAGEGWVWVARGNREVVRIDPDSGELSQRGAQVPGVFNVTAGESAAWALGVRGRLTRIDPGTGEPAAGRPRVPPRGAPHQPDNTQPAPDR